MTFRAPIVDPGRGFRVVYRGEGYWVDMDVRTNRVTIDLQHHGFLGQPGEVERVGEGIWREERIVERQGSLTTDGWGALESALREHVREGQSSRN